MILSVVSSTVQRLTDVRLVSSGKKITFLKKTDLALKQIKLSGINIFINNCGSFFLLIQLSNMKLLAGAGLIFFVVLLELCHH